jgi:hypothetical protein
MPSASLESTACRTRQTDRRPAAHEPGTWWPWIVTFIGFPPAGLLGRAVAGRVDDFPAAALAGIVAGGVLGTVQWALLRRRGVSARWIAGTCIGFGVGLSAGAALVSYRTDRPSLVLMGAVAGLTVGLLQAKAIQATPRQLLAWGVATAGLWALGWSVTSGVIDVDEQWPIFGSSGALVVVALQSLFIRRVLPIPATTASSD